MRIDTTSMFFNSKIEGKTATTAWGTALGQSKNRDFRVEKPGSTELLVGMSYKSVSQIEKLDASKGSSNREILMVSVFTKIYINGNKIENSQYVLILVREHTESFDGRLNVSYASYLKYDGKSNQECIDLMREALGCTVNGCWFVYDISILNQDEIHFSAIVVDKENPKIYTGTSQERSR